MPGSPMSLHAAACGSVRSFIRSSLRVRDAGVRAARRHRLAAIAGSIAHAPGARRPAWSRAVLPVRAGTHAGIEYVLGGSLASACQGEPRATSDTDFVRAAPCTVPRAVDNGDGGAMMACGAADGAATFDRDGKTKEETMPLLTEGSPAPAFSVPNQDGTPTTLDQFAGKWLVLWWYPKADTPG